MCGFGVETGRVSHDVWPSLPVRYQPSIFARLKINAVYSGAMQIQTNRRVFLKSLAVGTLVGSLGAVERNRRQRQLEARQKEFQENAGAIRDFQNATMKSLEMEMRKDIDAIRGEIKVVVAAKAKEAGFTLVLDKGTLVFTDGSDDLTKGVLERLNANDPRKSSAATPGKAPKK